MRYMSGNVVRTMARLLLVALLVVAVLSCFACKGQRTEGPGAAAQIDKSKAEMQRGFEMHKAKMAEQKGKMGGPGASGPQTAPKGNG